MARSRRPTDEGEEEKKVAEVLELQFPSVSDKYVSLDLYPNIKPNLTRLFLLLSYSSMICMTIITRMMPLARVFYYTSKIIIIDYEQMRKL